MKIRLIKKYKEIPPQPGETYKTKFATGDMFTVKRVVRDTVYGIYVGREHLGECPLYTERLILPKSDELVSEQYECPHCHKTIDI